MNQYAFLVTSAINTKFGIFNSEQRLTQTLATINSIKSRAPGAKVILVEMGAIPLTTDQSQQLSKEVDKVLSFNSDQTVIDLFNSTDNWDIVKNVTEVMCFGQALSTLVNHTDVFEGVQRAFKISGRYTLTDDFDIEYYNQYNVQHHMVVSQARSSQFSYELTGVKQQYMSRLWSWPTALMPEVLDVYSRGLVYMQERIVNGGYCDIEHMLYKFLDHNKVIEKELVGICGNIGPNGAAVKD
jgi:hypothetical protein